MTRPDRDYDEVLSRELHSMLDRIEPAGDGLMRIRQRIAEPWLKRKLSLLRAELAALGWLIVVRCEPLFSRASTGFAALAASSRQLLRSVSAALGFTAWGSSRRRDAGSHRWRDDAEPQGWLGRTMVWLRPTLAVTAAVIIVVAGIFALVQAQAPPSVTPTDNGSSSAAHHSRGHHPRAGAPAGRTTRAQTAAHPPHGKPSAHTSASASKQGSKTVAGGSPPPCPPTPTPTVSSSPSPSPSPTGPSPSPTATPTATPTIPSPGAPPTTPAKTRTPSCSS